MTWHTPDAEQEDRPPLGIWTRKEVDRETLKMGRAEYGTSTGRKHRRTTQPLKEKA